jgi:hypothetical protein
MVKNMKNERDKTLSILSILQWKICNMETKAKNF